MAGSGRSARGEGSAEGEGAEPERGRRARAVGGRSLRGALSAGFAFLLLAAMAVLSMGTSVFMGQRLTDEILNKNAAIASEAAYLITIHLDSAVDSLSGAAELIRTSAPAFPVGESFERRVLQSLNVSGRFQSIRMIGADGTVLAATPDSGTEGFSQRGRPELAATPDRPYRGPVFLSGEGLPAIPIAVRRGDRLVSAELSLSWLNDFVAALSFGRTGRVSIADADGTIIAHRDRNLADRRVNVSNQRFVAAARRDGRSTMIYQYEGIRRIGATVLLEGWGWTLTVSQATSEAYASVRLLSWLIVAALCVIGMVVFLAMNGFLRQMLAPLGLLLEGARRAAQGDYRGLGSVPKSFAEINALLAAFDAMVLMISEREQALTLSNQHIERSLEEKSLLLREVHHRVKNNMQVISSLLSLQRSRLEDGKATEAFAEAEQRVRSMALVHENLYLSENLASIDLRHYLEELVRSLVGEAGPDWEVDGQTAALGIDQAVPCALAVNELVLNALKYGCADGGGRLKIDVARDGGRVAVAVNDSGPGLSEDFNPAATKGLGLTIVQALVGQLGGRFDWGKSELGGAHFVVSFPVSDGRSAESEGPEDE